MEATPRGIVAFARSDAGRKWIKYSAVSVVGMTVSQICIMILTKGFGVGAVLTNFLAVAISSIPAYLLNRAWVWGKHGKNHLMTEVLPFWAFSFAGLVFSSLLVAAIAPTIPHGETASAMDTFRVMVGNVGGFGILWIAKFFVLDKLLFVDRGEGGDDDGHGDPVDAVGDPSAARG
ncbi:MAG: GtrA family protein [Actinobacteria bacterium]|nr:GtrA family protein [Actinomycetota bacterium]